MAQPRQSISLARALAVFTAFLLACGMRFYVTQVLIPYQLAQAAAFNEPRGNLSDLFPRWLGTRELLLHGRSPYGADVTREIQAGYWGRPLGSGRADDPKDESRFAYPVYVVFLLAPIAFMPFATVQIAASWVLGILIVLSLLLWLRALRWSPSPTMQIVLTLAIFATYPVVQGIRLQQLTILVCAVVAAAMALLVWGRDLGAGALLAAATIKPQLVVLPASWLLFWAVCNWRERKRFVVGFIGGCLLLVASGEFVLPGWIGQFAQGVVAYQRYAGEESPLQALTTPSVGIILALLLLLATIVAGWRLRYATAGSSDFNLMLALVFSATLALMPRMASYNQLLLLPAVLLVAGSWRRLWAQSPMCRAACAFFVAVICWPSITAVVLMMASIFVPPGTLQRAWTVPLWTLPATSIAVLAPLAFLYMDSNRSLGKPC